MILILTIAFFTWLTVRWGVERHDAIEAHFNVGSMTIDEKRRVLERYFAQYPDYEDYFLALPPPAQRQIVESILSNLDREMQMNKPRWWQNV
jgi:hypothetical protein